MYEDMRFWLERGIDGFRVDVLWHLIKDAAFRDKPPNPICRSDETQYNALAQGLLGWRCAAGCC